MLRRRSMFGRPFHGKRRPRPPVTSDRVRVAAHRVFKAIQNRIVNRDDPMTLEPRTCPDDKFYVVTEDKKRYFFLAEDLVELILESKKIPDNPYTGRPFSPPEVLRLFHQSGMSAAESSAKLRAVRESGDVSYAMGMIPFRAHQSTETLDVVLQQLKRPPDAFRLILRTCTIRLRRILMQIRCPSEPDYCRVKERLTTQVLSIDPDGDASAEMNIQSLMLGLMGLFELIESPEDSDDDSEEEEEDHLLPVPAEVLQAVRVLNALVNSGEGAGFAGFQ